MQTQNKALAMHTGIAENIQEYLPATLAMQRLRAVAATIAPSSIWVILEESHWVAFSTDLQVWAERHIVMADMNPAIKTLFIALVHPGTDDGFCSCALELSG